MFTISQPTTVEELEEYYDLRWRVLRQPWSQPRESEKDEFESNALHVIACDESGAIIGVGRLHTNAHEAQIRYMAVEEAVRGHGVGRAIVERLEAMAMKQGSASITLNARKNVVAFYERLGYSVTGVGPTLFGVIEHLNMAKNLPETSK